MSQRIVLTHGLSLSNLPLLVAEGRGFFEEEGLEVEVPQLTDVSSTAKLLSDGQAQLGTAAFTHPFIGCQRADPPIMVAGSGLTGISLLAQPHLTDTRMLRGKSLATFRSDPMEVLAYDKLKSVGLGFKDVDLRYIDNLGEALHMFRAGELDAVTVVEPHANRLRKAGAVELSNGTDLWGETFPDTVLIASRSFLDTRPDAVEATLRAMLKAEDEINGDLEGSLAYVRAHYPGFSTEELVAGAKNQPPCTDIRRFIPMMLGRWESLQELKLAPAGIPVPRQALELDRFAHLFEGR
jgi:ABC-type nitrate/sulfonate/bicarbonate transport system substrate-binding protein